MFKLEKRKMIFQSSDYIGMSLILKEKILNKVLEVFALFLLILFMFSCFTGR
jgi:hypothetical protein